MSNNLGHNDKLIHSSVERVKRVGLASDLPGSSYPDSIGIVVIQGRFGGYHLTYHHPKLSSMVSGDSLECEIGELDNHLRDHLLAFSHQCKELAEDLLSHSKRLKELAEGEESLVDASVAESKPVGIRQVETPTHSPIQDKNRANSSHSSPRTPNLGIFD